MNKVQSAYEKMMSEGTIKQIIKPEQKVDEFGRDGGSPGTNLEQRVKKLEQRMDKIESLLKLMKRQAD